MGWRDKAVAAVFLVAVLASAGTIAWVVGQTREDARAEEQVSGSTAEREVRGLALDYGRAVQRDDPEAACILLTGDAYEAFDCRFGRTDVPKELAIPEDATVAAGEVVVQGEQALVTLRGGPQPQPVRLQRTGRRWKIVRVGLPRRD